MRFLNSMFGSFPGGPRARHERRSSNRRRAPLALETLEGRSLLTVAAPAATVSLQFGNLAIHAASNTTTEVSIASGTLTLTASGAGGSSVTQTFDASSIYNITYTGGSAGGNTFINNTNLVSLDYAYGGNNHIVGGGSFNYVFFWGNNNSFSSTAGSVSDVFQNGGTGNDIDPLGTVYVFA